MGAEHDWSDRFAKPVFGEVIQPSTTSWRRRSTEDIGLLLETAFNAELTYVWADRLSRFGRCWSSTRLRWTSR